MVRLAHIINGVVVNISLAEKLQPGDVDGDGAFIGDNYVDGRFVRPSKNESASGLSVPAWKIHIELHERGLLERVNDLIGAIGGEPAIRWSRCPVYDRSHKAWDALCDRLNMTPSDVDEIFLSAQRRT